MLARQLEAAFPVSEQLLPAGKVEGAKGHNDSAVSVSLVQQDPALLCALTCV